MDSIYIDEEKMTVEQFLDNVGEILSEREKEYGDAAESFDEIAGMWSSVVGKRITPRQVAIMMIMLKLNRLIHDDSQIDSFMDLAGYSAIGGTL